MKISGEMPSQPKEVEMSVDFAEVARIVNEMYKYNVCTAEGVKNMGPLMNGSPCRTLYAVERNLIEAFAKAGCQLEELVIDGTQMVRVSCFQEQESKVPVQCSSVTVFQIVYTQVAV